MFPASSAPARRHALGARGVAAIGLALLAVFAGAQPATSLAAQTPSPAR